MNLYGRRAMAYWQTYRPSETAKLPDPEAFFTHLGNQVQAQVTEATFANAGKMTTDSLDNQRRLERARRSAEETAMAELVYLPMEPGTENRELPRTGPLPGWEDEPTEA